MQRNGILTCSATALAVAVLRQELVLTVDEGTLHAPFLGARVFSHNAPSSLKIKPCCKLASLRDLAWGSLASFGSHWPGTLLVKELLLKQQTAKAEGLAAPLLRSIADSAMLLTWQRTECAFALLPAHSVWRKDETSFERSNASRLQKDSAGLSSSRFEKAASLAEAYRDELARLRRRLEEHGVELPLGRFGDSDAELLRFAYTQGLCSAHTDIERNNVLERTAEQVSEAVQWLHSHKFLSDEALQRWQPMLHWASSETVQHPLLVIRLGQATRECSGPELEEFAEAIISQVQRALETKFSDAAGQPEQMVVAAYCTGASTLQASHVLKLIKHVSLTLNQFYPGRLHCFYLVDLPRMIRWPVKAIIALGHPATRKKVVMCEADDERLPPELRS